ncbi:MAG: 16S rRNA (guanine(527)-N(7))-methyltransferase RsmG [Flavobacteriales bacterium]|nr:16S rRNA (guanine(527)-N(7))-methyltransferase RsmG [Flavobacteriales bacterium]
MQIIDKYFPDLSTKQREQFLSLEKLYNSWNNKINLVSRKSINRFYTIHVLHSLAISKVVYFEDNAFVLDVGTGGGFPGIPLAILFPKTKFLLLDSISKKIKVVDNIISSIKIKNIKTKVERVENFNQKFDFIISRAVTNMSNFINIVNNNLKKDKKLQGIFYLKGGELDDELKNIKNITYNIDEFFEEDFFKTKKIIYISSKDL